MFQDGLQPQEARQVMLTLSKNLEASVPEIKQQLVETLAGQFNAKELELLLKLVASKRARRSTRKDADRRREELRAAARPCSGLAQRQGARGRAQGLADAPPPALPAPPAGQGGPGIPGLPPGPPAGANPLITPAFRPLPGEASAGFPCDGSWADMIRKAKMRILAGLMAAGALALAGAAVGDAARALPTRTAAGSPPDVPEAALHVCPRHDAGQILLQRPVRERRPPLVCGRGRQG